MTAPDIPVDQDLPDDDVLLGVPLRDLVGPNALQGLGLVVLAIVILVWPNRSDAVLGILAGIGAGYWAVTASIGLVRHQERRRFWPLLGVAIGGGMSAALLTQPETSLRSAAQFGGMLLLVMAARALLDASRSRGRAAWPWAKAAGAGVAGGLLIEYPLELLAAATAVTALVMAGAGIIEVVGVPEPGHGQSPAKQARSFSPGDTFVAWIRYRPEVAESRALLQEKLFFEGPASAVRYARFVALMGFASVIASVGVVVESTAVVIGAMLIAPLMVPLMGTAFSAAMGWPRRMARCAAITLSGMGIAVTVGALVGAMAPRALDLTTNQEVLSRISPTIVDLVIAVAAGAAGAYAMARRDVSDSLPGVAVAIALVPPLTVVGLCWQQQEWSAGNGALLLFLTNAVAILLAGGSTFVLVGAAPLTRINETQERFATTIVGIVTVAVVIIVLLSLNGRQLARTELVRTDVDDAVDMWIDDHEDFRVTDRRTRSDGTLVIDLTGPSRPPDMDDLLSEIHDSTGGDVPVRVTWTISQQVTIDDD